MSCHLDDHSSSLTVLDVLGRMGFNLCFRDVLGRMGCNFCIVSAGCCYYRHHRFNRRWLSPPQVQQAMLLHWVGRMRESSCKGSSSLGRIIIARTHEHIQHAGILGDPETTWNLGVTCGPFPRHNLWDNFCQVFASSKSYLFSYLPCYVYVRSAIFRVISKVIFANLLWAEVIFWVILKVISSKR